MTMVRYSSNRTFLATLSAGIEDRIPVMWPERRFTADPEMNLAEGREATAYFNEGLLIIGFGDGGLFDLLMEDPVANGKLIHCFVLPEERLDFAHWLGSVDIEKVLRDHKLSLHFPGSPSEADLVLDHAYNGHDAIARLAGTTIVDGHPLHPAAAAQRAAWLPTLRKTVVQRFDCLGNDVYDTFMGAKHALMHGLSLVKQPRSSDYRGRYAGKSAICIASGPSGVAAFDRIKELQHEHVIICADSILGGLLDRGIEPDFVCMVERPDVMHKLIDAHAPRCKTVLFALPVVHPTSVTPFGDRVAWWWNADDLYPWLDPNEPSASSGRSTGTMTVGLAALLGCSTAYLVGHDLAFKDGKSHGGGTDAFALEVQEKINRELSRNNPNYYRRTIEVPRNGGGTIETMGVWDIFRSDIELLVSGYQSQTRFVNLNIDLQSGAVIHGTVAGALPEPTGTTLEKSHPTRTWTDEQCTSYQAKARQLIADFDVLRRDFRALTVELAGWRPLRQDRSTVEAMGVKLNLTKPVDERNKMWFAYVFRAALRNLMVRLHLNTYVRTMGERNWNQVQVMRLYAASMPELMDRLEPELKQALESLS